MKKLHYKNGVIALEYRGNVITTNLPEQFCFQDETFLDTNNVPNAEELLIKAKVQYKVIGQAQSGYCTYPKIKLL